MRINLDRPKNIFFCTCLHVLCICCLHVFACFRIFCMFFTRFLHAFVFFACFLHVLHTFLACFLPAFVCTLLVFYVTQRGNTSVSTVFRQTSGVYFALNLYFFYLPLMVCGIVNTIIPAVMMKEENPNVNTIVTAVSMLATILTSRGIKNNKTRTSKVGAISKVQKTQNIFFQKKSHSAEKCKRGDPLGFINIHSVAKYEKTRRGDPFETFKICSKKSRTVPNKIQRGDPLGKSGFVGFLGKVKK